MELYQLRGFAAIAEVGQLTRAAEKLHLSQPALSAQLKALEEELELVLFDRTSTGMVLTAAGRRILAGAAGVLAAADGLRAEARALHSRSRGSLVGKASIGTLSDPDFIRLGEFMGLAVARHPMLEIELHQEVTGAARHHVLEGVLDASFFYGDLDDARLAGRPLRDVIYRIAAPALWEERLQGADWKALAEMPWIIPPPISTHHALVYALLARHGVTPTRVVEADQEAVVSSLVVAGLGVALMREDNALAREAAGEVCLWRDVRLETRLWFIHLREREHDPVMRALLAVLDEIWPLTPALAAGRSAT
jgi:DNA-binding transcriptional LysR family regulator